MAKKAAKKTAKKTAKKVTKKRAAGRKNAGVTAGAELPEAEPMHPAPVPLDAIVGQERALGVLRSSLGSGRVHHAWIFHGSPGVGKFTAALAFAALLLEPALDRDLAGNPSADPGSETQRLLRERAHPDLHVVRKELARYHEDKKIRDRKLLVIPNEVVIEHLVKPAALASSRAGGLASKVFIVDEAERLDLSLSNATSQNAILKTLEEPAPGTVIILVTSSEDRLLPTIRSRCQRVAFGPLRDDETLRVAADHGAEVAPGDAERAARLAEGSPGRLIELIETGVLGWDKQLQALLDDAAKGRFRSALGPTMAGLVDGWAKARAESRPNGSKEAANREGAARMFELIAGRARNGLAHPRATGRALGWIEAVQRAEVRVRANTQLALVFEGLAADLAAGSTPEP